MRLFLARPGTAKRFQKLSATETKYQYEAITYNESYALTLENTKARLDVISDALGDLSKPRKREESTMTYDGSTFVNLFHPRTRDGITAATTAKSNEMLKYQVLFPIFLYCRPSIAISASLSELTEGIATEAKNGRDCTKLTLRRSGERTETIIWVTTDSACLPVQVSRLDIATGHALHEFVMKYRIYDSKNTFLSSWSFTDHTTGEPSTTASDLVSFTIVKPPIDESKFSTELPQGTVVVDRESTQRYVVRGKNRSDVLKPEVLHGRSLRTVVTGSKWLSVLSLVVVLSVLVSIGFGYSQWKRR